MTQEDLLKLGLAIKEIDDAKVDISRQICKGEDMWRIKHQPKAGGFRMNFYGATFFEVYQKWKDSTNWLHRRSD